MKINILAFGAHPDDVELACSGTLYNHIQKGYTAGIIDLTRGELGSRGTVDTRNAESKAASDLLGIQVRENLDMADGFFENNKENQLKVVKMLRKYQPDIVFMNAPYDRHPDHGKGAQLVKDACFLSGLIKVETRVDGVVQVPWRPKRMFHYIQDTFIEPTFVLDISDSFDAKVKSIECYATQFHSTTIDGPQTYISTSGFMRSLEARAFSLGKRIGVKYGEGFIICGSTLGIKNLFDMVLPELV
jgi:N-acetylglucosamine malate deacetylase 1